MMQPSLPTVTHALSPVSNLLIQYSQLLLHLFRQHVKITFQTTAETIPLNSHISKFTDHRLQSFTLTPGNLEFFPVRVRLSAHTTSRYISLFGTIQRSISMTDSGASAAKSPTSRVTHQNGSP